MFNRQKLMFHMNIVAQNPMEHSAHMIHLPFCHCCEEWQSNCTIGDVLGIWKIAALIAEHFDVKRLQMNGRKILAALDTVTFQTVENPVPVFPTESIAESNDINEPAAASVCSLVRN